MTVVVAVIVIVVAVVERAFRLLLRDAQRSIDLRRGAMLRSRIDRMH